MLKTAVCSTTVQDLKDDYNKRAKDTKERCEKVGSDDSVM